MGKKRRTVPKTCVHCGVDFMAYRNQGPYCSQACYHAVARTHGAVSGGRSTEYIIWQGIKARCLKSSSPSYSNYGGRGITICDAWRDSFEGFLADVGHRPGPDLTIDRIDTNGNYEPGNVRWATQTEQGRNRRDNRLLTLNGVTHCVAEWAEITRMSTMCIKARLRQGWSDERTLTEPVRQSGLDHCRWGHPYTTENTKVNKKTGLRQCRMCLTGRFRLPNEAGIRYQSRSRSSGTLITIYLANEQGIDVGDQKYAVVCRDHGSILGVSTLAEAHSWLAMPAEWCDACRMGTTDNVTAAEKMRGY